MEFWYFAKKVVLAPIVSFGKLIKNKIGYETLKFNGFDVGIGSYAVLYIVS